MHDGDVIGRRGPERGKHGRLAEHRQFGRQKVEVRRARVSARQRVDRALARLGLVFRRKGVAVPSATAVASVLAQSTQSAPAGLLASATGAAAPPAASSLASAVLNDLAPMTKTQIAVCAVALAAIPLAIQQVALAELEQEEQELTRRIAVAPAAARPPGSGPLRSVPGRVQSGGEGESPAAFPADLDAQFEGLARV
jgi:hypothetical protein